jgi:DNA-directed RNA polymerase subunit M/transcription elongation factor TFIIS
MGKAVYVGTVVAANNQQEAITSFLKTVNSAEDNKKCLFRISKSSDQVYLTTLSTIVSPMSPVTGETDSPVVTSKMETIASALALPDTNEIVAKENFKLVSSVCPECDSVLVADSKKLLCHCIVCGAEQDQELEDEEHVDLSILNNDDEHERKFFLNTNNTNFTNFFEHEENIEHERTNFF